MPESSTNRIAIGICAMFLIVGTLAVIAVWGAYFTDSALQVSGPRVTGTVVKKEVVRSSDGDSDFIVHYRFPLSSGAEMTAQRNLPKARWVTISQGDSIVIVYAPDNPKRNFPEGHGVVSLWAPMLASLVFGGLAVFGGVALMSLYRQKQRDEV